MFDTVKFNEFSFLLDVYKMRPGFQREEDKIKKDVANKINKLFDRQVTFDYSYKFEPVSREKSTLLFFHRLSGIVIMETLKYWLL